MRLSKLESLLDIHLKTAVIENRAAAVTKRFAWCASAALSGVATESLTLQVHSFELTRWNNEGQA